MRCAVGRQRERRKPVEWRFFRFSQSSNHARRVAVVSPTDTTMGNKRKRDAPQAGEGDKGALPEASYWRKLAPGLHLGDAGFQAGCAPLTLPSARLAELRHELLTEGLFTLHPTELPWASSLKAMRIGVRRLVKRGWPASLLLMYDEAWAMAHQLSEIMRAVSGNANSLDTLAWSVTPSLGQSGFAPHRDRQPADVPASFRADGSPKYATAWVALSEASPDNSCMHIVPRTVDPGYHAGDDPSPEAEDPLIALMRNDAAVQSIRCCPLKPGGVVVFSHRSMHWGSKGRSTCDRPRVSISFGCSDPSFEKPYFESPAKHLPFPKPSVRAALASAQLINYHERFRFPAALLRRFGASFRAKRVVFTDHYNQKTAAEFKAACEDIKPATEGEEEGDDDGDDEEEDAALDDALDAMLDAQMRAGENLYDDFDEFS